MNREEAKDLVEIVVHYANGGDLWWYNQNNKKWYKQNYLYESNGKFQNIIEDKDFEDRKKAVLV